jgi:hypothetical protein
MMGTLNIFCAGTSIDVLPARRVKNLFLNVFDNGRNEKAISATKRMIAFATPDYTMLDSSGYQIFTSEAKGKSLTFDPRLPLIMTKQKFNISPSHVVEAAYQIQPKIVIGLDFPIRKLSKKEDREREYLYKSHFNAEWAKQTAQLREQRCPTIEFFLPIQVYSLSDLEHFLTLIDGIRYDGLSMPVRNLGPSGIALFLLRFFQMGITKAHILGSTSFPRIAVGAFFARHYFEWLSLDSTSWRKGAEFQSYLDPGNLSALHTANDGLIDENIPITCECPFCKDRSFNFIKSLPYSDKVAFLRSHNFWVTEKVGNDLFANAGDLLTFEKFLRSRGPRTRGLDDLIECLWLIDFYKNEDINVLKTLLKIAA